MVRAALIALAYLAVAEFGALFDSQRVLAAYGAVFALSFIIIVLGRNTDRRLFVNAETGLITWKRLSWPFSKPTRVSYIDSVSELHYESGDLKLFGLDNLEEHRWIQHNQNRYTEGYYRRKVLAKLVERFNLYHEMFFRHDSEAAKERRRMFRLKYERRLAPARERAQQSSADDAAKAASEKETAAAERAARGARAEEKKRREVESKFTS